MSQPRQPLNLREHLDRILMRHLVMMLVPTFGWGLYLRSIATSGPLARAQGPLFSLDFWSWVFLALAFLTYTTLLMPHAREFRRLVCIALLAVLIIWWLFVFAVTLIAHLSPFLVGLFAFVLWLHANAMDTAYRDQTVPIPFRERIEAWRDALLDLPMTLRESLQEFRSQGADDDHSGSN